MTDRTQTTATPRPSEDAAPSSGDGLTWLVREKLGERRFYALVEAIRGHEAAAHRDGELSTHDRELYSLLRRTCEEL